MEGYIYSEVNNQNLGQEFTPKNPTYRSFSTQSIMISENPVVEIHSSELCPKLLFNLNICRRHSTINSLNLYYICRDWSRLEREVRMENLKGD